MAVLGHKELLQHELSDLYSAERAIVTLLPQLASETDNARVRSAYQMHEQQTRQQVRNLDQVFQLLGINRIEHITCHAVLGLKQEHDEFVTRNPPTSVLTLFDLDAASRLEHYEIASYQGLVANVRMMGQLRVAHLLEQNLQQEEEMARKVEQLSQELDRQQIQRVTPDLDT
jgi:ferritin-like metal-binding protein YciE